jgi:hypothetical protein
MTEEYVRVVREGVYASSLGQATPKRHRDREGRKQRRWGPWQPIFEPSSAHGDGRKFFYSGRVEQEQLKWQNLRTS